MRSSLAALFLLIFAPFSYAQSASIPATIKVVKYFAYGGGYNMDLARFQSYCGSGYFGEISESKAQEAQACLSSLGKATCVSGIWMDGSTFKQNVGSGKYGGTVKSRKCDDDTLFSEHTIYFSYVKNVNEYVCADSSYPTIDNSVSPPVCLKGISPEEQTCQDLAGSNPESQIMYHSCGDGTLRDALGCELIPSGVGVCTGSGADCTCASQVKPTGKYIPPGTPGTNDAYSDGSLVKPETTKTDCVISPSNPSCTSYEEVKDPPRTECVYVDGVPTSCNSTPGATRNTTTQTTVESTTDANGNVTTTTRTTTITTTCTESGCTSTERVNVTTDVRDSSGNKIGGSTTTTGDGAGGATAWRGGNSYTDDGRLKSDNSDLVDTQGMPDPFAAGDGLDSTGANMLDATGSELEAWLGESFVNDPSNLSPSDGDGLVDMFTGFDRECVIPDVKGVSLNLCESADKARPFLAFIFAVMTIIYIWRRVSSTFAEMGA